MRRRHLMTILGVSVCLLLFLYVTYWEKPRKTDSKIPLYSLNLGDIAAVEIAEGGKQLRLERDPEGTWQFAKGGLADPQKVESLLETWKEPQVTPVASNSTPRWALFGLDPPQKELLLTLAQGGEKRLQFGKKNPVGWQVYLKESGGEKLYLVPEYLVTSLSTDPTKFKPISPPPPVSQKP